jgi:hypothetical protein
MVFSPGGDYEGCQVGVVATYSRVLVNTHPSPCPAGERGWSWCKKTRIAEICASFAAWIQPVDATSRQKIQNLEFDSWKAGFRRDLLIYRERSLQVPRAFPLTKCEHASISI